MEIFATGLASPECPIILDNGDLLVVEMRQDRSAISRIDGTTREIHPTPKRELFGNVFASGAPEGFIGPDGMKFAPHRDPKETSP